MCEKKEIWVEYRTKKGWKQITIPVKQECRVEAKMRKLAEKYKNKEKVYINFYVFNSISKTWMNMSTFYVNENRYVKLT